MTPAGDFAELIRSAARRLAEAGVEDPVPDARRLMAAAATCDTADLIARSADLPEPNVQARFETMIDRRAAREPVSRILGRRAFWELEFDVAPEVLDPRPETEGVVEAALDRLSQDAPARVVDAGVGSGCILLSILHARPQATGVGIDASSGAIATARANAARLGLAGRVDFLVGDWLAPLSGAADIIVSNPPYIASAEIGALAPEVRRYDPPMALDGGSDGLAPYRQLARQAPRLLTPGGWLIVEIGAGQAPAVCGLFADCGLQEIVVHADLAQIDRVVCARQADGQGRSQGENV